MQGQTSSNLYSLTDGLVKICTHTPDGREQIVGLSVPGNLLVGLQSLNDERYAYTAIAASNVTACRINHRNLLARVQDRGDIAMRLIQAVNAQLAHSRALMEVMGHKCGSGQDSVIHPVDDAQVGSRQLPFPDAVFPRGDGEPSGAQ